MDSQKQTLSLLENIDPEILARCLKEWPEP